MRRADTMDGRRRKRWGVARQLVVELLYREGSVARAELARQVGVSRSAISEVVADLISEGIVVEEPAQAAKDSTRPSPRSSLKLRSAAAQAFGIDFSADRLRVVVADPQLNVLDECEQDLRLDHTPQEAIDLAASFVAQLMQRQGLDRDRVVGVGVGVPGPIDQREGVATPSSISASWVGVDVAGRLHHTLRLPVLIDNNANLAALAETLAGSGKGHQYVVYVKASKGVGSGIVVNGRLFRGTAGMAGEIGHMTVRDDGPLCPCGNRGCLEAYAGTAAQLDLAQVTLPDIRTYGDLIRGAEAGNRGCRRVVTDAGRQLAVALASLCNIMNPSVLIIGGEMGGAFSLIAPSMREVLFRNALHLAAGSVDLLPAALGDRAGAIGATALIFQEGGGLARLGVAPASAAAPASSVERGAWLDMAGRRGQARPHRLTSGPDQQT